MPDAKPAPIPPQPVEVVATPNPGIIALDPSGAVIIAGNEVPLAMTITVRDLDLAKVKAYVMDANGVPDTSVPVTPVQHGLNDLHVTIIAQQEAKAGERDIAVTYGEKPPTYYRKTGITIV
jgi:hypothetical protein